MAETREILSGTLPIGGGVELYYEECGTGRPLVLVHGLWGSGRFFRHQLQGLSSRYRVIAVDLRGHGRSSMTLDEQTVPSYARDLRAFLRGLRLTSVVGVGWSMGAFVWWDYYQQFGADGIEGLVVIDQPPTDLRSADFPNGLIAIDVLRDWHYAVHTRRDAFMREVLPMMFGTPPAPADAQWMWEEMVRSPAAVAGAVLVDQSLRDYREVIKRCPIPMLVCSGRLSAQPPEGTKLIVETAPSARLVIFERSGHSLFFEEPERFNAVCGEFVESLAV